MTEQDNNVKQSLMDSLNATFGQYRAEYIESDIFEFFTHPNYWQKLSAVRPCILEGGRGTGKTTALKGMSYEGQYALHGASIGDWESLGAYWRIESNIVSSFKGKRIDETEWNLYFAHYVNVQLCLLLLDFIKWRQEELGISPKILKEDWQQVLNYFGCTTTAPLDLRKELQSHLVKFQMSLLRSALGQGGDVTITPLGAPLNSLIRSLRSDRDFKDRHFAFCIDEYENLIPYQQNVLNTLIKHVGDSKYTFKIGTKKNGIKDFGTLAKDQYLQSPADYSQIDISQEVRDEDFEVFSSFAKNVCNKRLRVGFKKIDPSVEIDSLFPDITEDDEAKLLGIDSRNKELRIRLIDLDVSAKQLEYFDSLDSLSAYLVEYWALSKGISPLDALSEAVSDTKAWKTRKVNYSYPMLFTLRPQVVGRVKFYSGWDTYIRLSDGNIRLLLQLIYEALAISFLAGNTLSDEVTPEMQTKAAEFVGEQQVESLLGISRIGGTLKQLILSLGRVFEVMARHPHGHAPEVNQFRVNRSDLDRSQIDNLNNLLQEAVMHSALVPFTANKKSSKSSETNAADYMMHPIMSSYFGYSNRRKRRMTIAGHLILEMASDNASKAIDQVLNRQGRKTKADVPEQLSIYSEFFHGNN